MNRLIATAGSVALITGGTLLLATTTPSPGWAGSSAEGRSACSPQPAVAATFSDWHQDHLTDWQGTDIAPADPDGQQGDDNPANLVRISEMDTQKVVDVPAQDPDDEVTGYVKWTYNKGQDSGGSAPAFDPDDSHWNRTGDRNKAEDVTGGEVHQSDQGNGNWFYWQPIIVHHDAVPAVTHTEYRWSVDTRTYTPGRDAVDCPDAGGTPSHNAPTDAPESPSGGHSENPPVKTSPLATSTTPHEPGSTPSGRAPSSSATVPTVIDAGL